MHLLYVVASYLLFWLLSPVLLLHPKTRPGLARRLGLYPRDFLEGRPHPRIWLHGASAGDLLALSPMVRELRERYPRCTIILSTLTNSGHLMGDERTRRDPAFADVITFAPYDLWGAVRRTVRAIQPDLLVLEYTEIWPNLIRAAKDAGVKVALTNGRFSPKRLGSYRLLFSLIGNPLRQLDLFLMREDDEAERVLGLGAPLERVWVTGNTKFDALLPRPVDGAATAALRAALGLPEKARVLIAGSTHEGEEGPVIVVFRRLLQDHPDLRLVIAPRYIERAEKLLALAQAEGLSARLRSRPPGGERVVILDTIGELAAAYGVATVVFVGGSFTQRGGQNILEPATQGKPVLFGPNMGNFHDSVQVLVGRGGIQVTDPEHLYKVLHDLLARPDKLAELGEMASAAVGSVRGASARNVAHMARLLPQVRESGTVTATSPSTVKDPESA
jgi:3-deoxy-D-manno-octulosonic-acid transferase